MKEFKENENFVPLSSDTHLIDYLNSQVILIGAREGKDVIKRDLGIDFEDDPNKKESDIINRLKIKNNGVPTKPLTEGKLA